MPKDRLIVFCPRCAEEITLDLEWHTILIQKERGQQRFITAETGVSTIEHTCVHIPRH